jgi:hypothetical protein
VTSAGPGSLCPERRVSSIFNTWVSLSEAFAGAGSRGGGSARITRVSPAALASPSA